MVTSQRLRSAPRSGPTSHRMRSLAPTLLLAAALLPCVGALSCAGEVAAGAPGVPQVLCTTAMIGDLAREVAGEDAQVITLFGADVDPHLFRPTRDDVRALMAADLVLHNGLHLEGHLTEALERVGGAGVEVIAVAERITSPEERLRSADADDPHVWMDPALWSRVPGLVAEALGREVPGARAELERRADALEARLLELDRTCAEAFATLDPERRVLLTAHDAFGYLGRRYDLEVRGIQGVSTASEASLGTIEELVDTVVERGIPAVFFESTVSERNVRALVEGARSRGHELRVGGVLHADAPGAAGTYERMVAANVETIVGGLAADAPCSAPEVAR